MTTQITRTIFHCTFHCSDSEFTSDSDSADETITKASYDAKPPQLRFHPGTWVKQCMCSVVPCVKLMMSHCLTFAYKQTPYVVIIYWSDVIKSAWWHEWNTVTENCTSSYHVWQKNIYIFSPRIFAMNSSYFNHVLFNTTSVQCQIWTAMSFIALWHSEVKMCLIFIICLRWRPCLNWFWKSIL